MKILLNRYTSQVYLFNKICFVIHAWVFDDIMTFEYLRS